MSAEQAPVEEFRSIIDGLIEKQVTTCRAKGRSWPDYNKLARIAGLSFVSLDQRDGRGSQFPLYPEHIWGVSPQDTYKADKFRGHVAIVSFADKPGLHRNWSINSQMQGINPRSIRELTEEEASGIIGWMKAPHLEEDALLQACQMTDDEVAKLTPRLDELAESVANLRDDLFEMSRTTIRSHGNAWNTRIN